MTGRGRIDEYVAELRGELRHHALSTRLVGEVEAHLREAVAARVDAGVAPDRAVPEAIGSFGTPQEVAAALQREVPPRSWLRAALVPTGVAATAIIMTFAAATAPRPGGVGLQRSAPPVPGVDAARVAGALRLSPEATEVLATAQMLGRRATACLLEHGGRASGDGGIIDPSGRASAACQPVLAANERYLEAPAFRELLADAQPRFAAAEECNAALRRRTDSAVGAGSRSRDASLGRTGASDLCHRRDGLPAATA